MSSIQPRRPLLPGVNVPLVALFNAENEDLDIEAIRKHAERIAQAGVTSVPVQGSNGEAVHLTREERSLVTSTVRKALDESGATHLPVVVGCGAQSVRETILFCQDAFAAGGDYALVLPPSYYKTACTPEVLSGYFLSVADASPVPILIYNYPPVVGGIDLSSDVITALAKHPNIVGCKLTCGNTGKLNRIAHAADAATATRTNSGWMCMGGSADFIVQALVAGGSGVVVGLGNIVPKLCVKVFGLYKIGKLHEAQKLQAILARADLVVGEGGVAGTKSGLQTWFGYGGVARRPLPQLNPDVAAKFDNLLAEAVALEKGL
ncbi:putative 4-hydroxy-2-oxoglutarate aldolase, mitochondrial [Exophiala dermatitidis]